MPDIRTLIAQIAAQNGIDPAYALAVAERESGFNPNAHASRSIYGLFQMSGPLRAKYGVPYGASPAQQIEGFASFTRDLRDEMTNYLGRPPTNGELYLAHYWGPERAARAIEGGNGSIASAFTPQELALNPELAEAGSVGNAASGIISNIDRRQAKYAGYGDNHPANGDLPVDFGSYGQPQDAAVSTAQAGAAGASPAPDFTQDGKLAQIDFSRFGTAQPTSPQTADVTDPGSGQPNGNVPTMPGSEVEPAAFMQGLASGEDYYGDTAVPKGDGTAPGLINDNVIPYPFIPADQPLPQQQPVNI